MRTTSSHPPIGRAKDRINPRLLYHRALTLAIALSLTAVWIGFPTVTASAFAETASAEIASAETAPAEDIFEEDTSAADTSAADPEATASEDESVSRSPVSATAGISPAFTSPEEISVIHTGGIPTGRTAYRPLYPYPAGAMAVTLYKDGKPVLAGHAAEIGGTVYVPVQRFADLFGSFRTVYTEATEQVVITGTNLSITVKVGDPFITVNDRIFYTGATVISLGGWIFVPLTAMCKALGAQVTIRQGYYDAFITSGNPAGVANAARVYDSADLYWLSRIISAEAKGESLEGQIAVGNVVMNRVRSSQFPDTVQEVVFDKKYGTQFAPVDNGTIYQTPTASAVRAAKICLEGYSLSSRILYFFNPRLSASNWIQRTRPYIMTIGNHKFYG